MNVEDCIKDKEFRKEFIRIEKTTIKELVIGHEGAINHHEDKLDILKELLDKIDLDDKEKEVLELQIKEIWFVNEGAKEIAKNLKILIGIYDKFLTE